MQEEPLTVGRAQEGDDRAREALARAWLPRVYGMALSVTRLREDAEEVTQEAFVRAFARLGGLRRAERFGPWLLAITRRLALDHLRAHRRQRTHVLAASTARVGPASVGAAGVTSGPDGFDSDGEAVRAAWAGLPDGQRVIVWWSVNDGATVRDIATWLGCSKSRVDRLRRRGLDAMRKELER